MKPLPLCLYPAPHKMLLAALVCLSSLGWPAASRCADRTPDSTRVKLPADALAVPLMRQATDYTCGVAALQAVLSYYGDDEREDRLAKQLKADHHNGTAYKQIASFATSRGYTVDFASDLEIGRLRQWLSQKRPVICLIQAWREKHNRSDTTIDTAQNQDKEYSLDWNDGHYVVAIGIDDQNVYFMDPSVSGHYAYLPIASFLPRWHDIDGKTKLNHFAMAVSKPDTVPDREAIEPIE